MKKRFFILFLLHIIQIHAIKSWNQYLSRPINQTIPQEHCFSEMQQIHTIAPRHQYLPGPMNKTTKKKRCFSKMHTDVRKSSLPPAKRMKLRLWKSKNEAKAFQLAFKHFNYFNNHISTAFPKEAKNNTPFIAKVQNSVFLGKMIISKKNNWNKKKKLEAKHLFFVQWKKIGEKIVWINKQIKPRIEHLQKINSDWLE